MILDWLPFESSIIFVPDMFLDFTFLFFGLLFMVDPAFIFGGGGKFGAISLTPTFLLLASVLPAFGSFVILLRYLGFVGTWISVVIFQPLSWRGSVVIVAGGFCGLRFRLECLLGDCWFGLLWFDSVPFSLKRSDFFPVGHFVVVKHSVDLVLPRMYSPRFD